MIKLKKLINESAWDREFGESLPTLSSVTEKHKIEEKKPINEYGVLDKAGDAEAKMVQAQTHYQRLRARLSKSNTFSIGAAPAARERHEAPAGDAAHDEGQRARAAR